VVVYTETVVWSSLHDISSNCACSIGYCLWFKKVINAPFLSDILSCCVVLLGEGGPSVRNLKGAGHILPLRMNESRFEV
jgi:hypothetical protein